MPLGMLLTSVSHFNLIHTECHAAAKTADAALRQPKREWVGATLRNGSVLCNALLPLRPPRGGAADTAWAAAVSAFWTQQVAAPSWSEAASAATLTSGGAGRATGTGSSTSADGALLLRLGASSGANTLPSAVRRAAALKDADSSLLRLSLIAADAAALLLRFAARLSFSDGAGGGGRASNARLLIALLGLGRYYAGEAASAAELADAGMLLAQAAGAAGVLGLEQGPTSTATDTGDDRQQQQQQLDRATSSTPFVMALSLLLSGPAEWMAARRSMLALCMRHGAIAAACADGAATPPSDAELARSVAPYVRMLLLVDWLQQWAKPALGAGGANSSSSSSGGWPSAMAERLADQRACAEAAEELLSCLEEAEACGDDLPALLDRAGLLGTVLGAASCSDGSVVAFVRAASAPLL